MWPTIIGLLFSVVVQRWIFWPTLNQIYSVLYMHLWVQNNSDRKQVFSGGEHVKQSAGFQNCVAPSVFLTRFHFIFRLCLHQGLTWSASTYANMLYLSFLTHSHSCSMKREHLRFFGMCSGASHIARSIVLRIRHNSATFGSPSAICWHRYCFLFDRSQF